MRNKPMLLSLMLSLVVILAACGSDPTATPQPTNTPTATPSADIAPTATPAAPAGDDEAFTLDDVAALLTNEEMGVYFPGLGPWETKSINSYEMAGGVDPSQVATMDSWWGWTYESPTRAGVTLSVIDFKTTADAVAHMQVLVGEGEATPTQIGDEGFLAEGGGLIIAGGRVADKIFMINAGAFADGAIDATLITSVGQLVASRL
jgi:hypothetical protein